MNELYTVFRRTTPYAATGYSCGGMLVVVLQVELYAENSPEHLLPFLQSSKQFNKEAALDVCRDKGLVREQVFILGRLSRASEALQLIISDMHDLPQAIAFVSSHADLWDELIVQVMKDPELTGQLLDQVCLV